MIEEQSTNGLPQRRTSRVAAKDDTITLLRQPRAEEFHLRRLTCAIDAVQTEENAAAHRPNPGIAGRGYSRCVNSALGVDRTFRPTRLIYRRKEFGTRHGPRLPGRSWFWLVPTP